MRVFRKTSKTSPLVTPKSQGDLHDLVNSPATTPTLSSSPLNTSLNKIPVRKTTYPSAESRHKDTNSGGSNASSGTSTPRLTHSDFDLLQSVSDSESVASSQGPNKKNSTAAFSELDFLPEVIEGYDEMEGDTNQAKEMLLHLQSLVSCDRVYIYLKLLVNECHLICAFEYQLDLLLNIVKTRSLYNAILGI